MNMTQNQKALRFQELHRTPGVLLIPNPWDAGSARILAGLGFEAFTTSSAAAAGVLGRCDGKLSRDEALAHARLIVEASDLPVAADLEHGFGDSPEAAAETIRLAARIGLVGGFHRSCGRHAGIKSILHQVIFCPVGWAAQPAV